MKRIYLLMIVMLVAAYDVMAQRNIDLSFKRFYKAGTGTPSIEITNATRFLFDGGGGPNAAKEINLAWQITNNATAPKDSVMMSDTLHIFNYFVHAGTPRGFFNITGTGLYLPAGSTSGTLTMDNIRAFGPDEDVPNMAAVFSGISGEEAVEYCDTVWVSGGPATAGNPPVEADQAGNEKCNNITFDAWATNVGDVDVDIEENGLLVYPNPAAARDIKIMFNFGNHTSHASVSIIDITGKVVYNQIIGNNLSGVQAIPLNISNIAPGMYSLRLATDNKTAIEKIYVN